MATVESLGGQMAAMKVGSTHLPTGNVPLAEKKKKEANIIGTPVEISTNCRRITLEKNKPIYKYAAQMLFFYEKENGTEYSIEKSKSVKKGPEHELDKHQCLTVYKKAVKMFPELQGKGPFFYDRQACLYALSLLPSDGTLSFVVTGADISDKPSFRRVEFKVTKVAESFQSTSNDVPKTVNSRPALVDRTILEALNQIISGPAIENENVLTIGNCVHYLYDDSEIDVRRVNGQGGKSSAVGASKAIKTLEGSDSSPSLFMTTELKTTLFHPDNATLLSVFESFTGFNPKMEANSPFLVANRKSFIGLSCYLNYGKTAKLHEDRTIVKIRSFGPSARDHTFKVGNSTTPTSVYQYYKDKYNINLKHPDLFTVVTRGRNGELCFFPVECLILCNSQPVRTEQMLGNEQADLIKIAAAHPKDRKRITDSVAKSVGLASENIQGFIKVSNPEKVTGIVLPKPDIVYAGNRKVDWKDPRKRGPVTDWMAAGSFAKPAKLTNWEVVFDRDAPLLESIQQITSTMRVLGMDVKDPSVSYIQRGHLKPIFENAKNNKCQLLLFITKTRNNYHAEMKSLEQEYDVLTQEVRFETALKLPQQQNTKKNIVNKINSKLGGLNYEIQTDAFKDPRRLIIGFETSERNGGGDGLVSIGFAANMMEHHQQFSGGYIYAERSNDMYGSILSQILGNIVKQVIKNRPNVKPNNLLIYFNGVTEGQFSLINETYVEIIKNTCKAINENFRPHITVIATSKNHNTRLYKSDAKGILNLEPGTVIDHTIVSPVLNEWYLTSAVARQGTCKATKFTLIFTTNPSEKLSDLEKLTNDLCYDHQIVFQPVSLPAPLYIAGMCSNRGAQILSFKKPVFTNGKLDVAATNAELGYTDKKLFGTRFNA